LWITVAQEFQPCSLLGQNFVQRSYNFLPRWTYVRKSIIHRIRIPARISAVSHKDPHHEDFHCFIQGSSRGSLLHCMYSRGLISHEGFFSGNFFRDFHITRIIFKHFNILRILFMDVTISRILFGVSNRSRIIFTSEDPPACICWPRIIKMNGILWQ
jgi:hypothetical protein